MKDNYPTLPKRFPTIFPSATGAAVPTPASPDGLDASLIASSGTRLPLGAAVPGGPPGLYETGAENPPELAGTDPVVDPNNPNAPAPPHSRFTLVQTGPATPPMLPGAAPTAGGPALPAAGPSSDLTRNATALALQQIMTAGPGGQPGTVAPAGGVAGPPPAGAEGALAPLGNAGRLMTAAAGMEGDRLGFAAQDVIKRMGPNAPSVNDTPEVRASKFAYFTKVMNDQIAQDPTLGTDGRQPSVTDLADNFHRLMATAANPRLVNLGTDAEGRPVEGTVDARGNFSPRAASRDEPKLDQPQYSEDGKFYRSGPKDDWKPITATGDKPLDTTAWMISGRPGGSYAAYRAQWKKENDSYLATEAAAKNASAGAKKPAAPAAKAPAAAIYRHEDIQAELRRRGLVK